MKNYILPLRDLVVHPGSTIPVYLDVPASVECINNASKSGQPIVLVAQKSWNYPEDVDDIYDIATVGNIIHTLNLPDDSMHVIIKTEYTVKLSDISVENGVFSAETEKMELLDDSDFEQTLALRDKIAENVKSLSASKKIKMDKLYNVIQNYPLPAFVDSIIQMVGIDTDTAVKILATNTWREKLITLLEQLMLLIETNRIEANINRRVQNQMENGQRQAILQEKMRAIQKEMGEDDDDEISTTNIRKKIEKLKEKVEVLLEKFKTNPELINKIIKSNMNGASDSDVNQICSRINKSEEYVVENYLKDEKILGYKKKL